MNQILPKEDPSFRKLKNKTIFLEYFDDQIENFKFPNNDEIPNKNIVRLMIQKISIANILNDLIKLEEYDDQHQKPFIKNLLTKSIIKFHQMQEIVLQEIEELSNKCCILSCCCAIIVEMKIHFLVLKLGKMLMRFYI